ncbi:hypothetical protein PVL29_025589 [Vitis rotundifolia]|uniref:F-box domain-containing protein n=1 Tax=Vitis rotundifolia TaxID=103349 RepID=A0AA39D4T9_VITRO|nr:hypothetical protein PVL29_025589 [Vitis rotundifolia]
MILVTQNENVFEVEEILTNILSRLPVKSLLVCKSVCKYWQGLICSPSFIHLHLIQSQENPSYVFCLSYVFWDNIHCWVIKTDGETTQSFPSYDGFYFKDMICSFNGLICCTTPRKSRTCFIRRSPRRDMDIIICNPATRKVLLLPPTPKSHYAPKLGVSFGPTINGYETFQFFDREEQLYECMVYSSITGSWKFIGTVAHAPSNSFNHVCIDGIVYWFSRSRIDGRLVGHILTVDREEKFSIIRIPEEETLYPLLVNLEGCLCPVAENGLEQKRFGIWALQNSKESVWVKKWSDYMPSFQIEQFDYIVVRKNEILCGSWKQYLLYNLGTRTWREFDWEYGRVAGFPPPLAYTESLLPCKY